MPEARLTEWIDAIRAVLIWQASHVETSESSKELQSKCWKWAARIHTRLQLRCSMTRTVFLFSATVHCFARLLELARTHDVQSPTVAVLSEACTAMTDLLVQALTSDLVSDSAVLSVLFNTLAAR